MLLQKELKEPVRNYFIGVIAFYCCFVSLPVYTQCSLNIFPANPGPDCYNAVEEVVWTDLVNVSVTGTRIEKTGGGNNNWNAGAASTTAVYAEGWAQTTVAETNTDRMFGLSSSNGGAGFGGIDYAFYLRSNGNLSIYEGGADRGTFGTYSSGDQLLIRIDAGVVKYFQNGSLLYISLNLPTLPLIVDVSLNDIGATLEDVEIVNAFDGQFSLNLSNPGTGPVYTWYLNGSADGTGTSYAPAVLNDGDLIYAEVVPGAGGCGAGTFRSNNIRVGFRDLSEFGQFYISATPDPSACKEAIEPAVFTNIENIFVSGNSVLKGQGGNNNWNAGANSLNTVGDNGYVEFIAAEASNDKMIGLSFDAGGSGFNSIDYAFYLQNNGNVRIYQNGSDQGLFGSYITSDIFRIAVEDGVVHYYQNGTLLYISNDVPSLPMIADISLNDEGAAIDDIFLSNSHTGEFTAFATNAGSSPTYQWQLNGVDQAGENGTTYTNAGLSDGDVITCVITPDLPGCSGITTTSEPITIAELAATSIGDFYIRGIADPNACKQATEEVTFTNIVNVFVTGNSLVKGQGGNNDWNAGANSFNTVDDNGYLEFTAAEDAYDKMIGLSADEGGSGFNSIDYAIYLQNNDNIRIYQNGSDQGLFGTYSAGDIFRVSVEDGAVKYYQNGILLYISNDVPSLPLLADASLNDEGAAIDDVIISNGNTGQFQVNTTNAGANPSFQWQLNGTDIPGETNSTYTNTSLSDGDIITCLIVPDLGGCSDVTYTSLPVRIGEITSASFGDFYVENTADPFACKEAVEEVTFTNVVNVFVTGNNVIKGQGGNNNWNAGTNSLNTVKNNGYLEFTAGDDAYDKMIGLSADEGGSGFNSIDYAIYLQNDDDIRIYQNGADQGAFGTYASGDIFRIAVENGVVRYYQNGTLLYISNDVPTLPLLVDLSLNDEGASLTDIVVSNGNTGNFTAITTNAGASPAFQWQLNGVDIVGETSSTYVNTSLSDGDIITCVITPDLGGCSDITYTSLPVRIGAITTVTFGDFYIENTAVTNACKEVIEEVTFTNVVNVFVSGNNVLKGQGGNNNWNAGANSLNTVKDNGYLEFTAAEDAYDKMIGLSADEGGTGFNSIDYAIFLQNDDDIRIYQNGADQGAFGTYTTGDIFRIAVENGEVKYYQNGNLLYRSNDIPSLPLLADLSLNDAGAAIDDIIVANGHTGEFTAITANAGASPSYQWQLNGVDIPGANASIYTNSGLADGDVITCIIIPDLGGCSDISYTSQPVIINDIAQPLFGDFYISNSPALGVQPVAFEEISWASSENAFLSSTSVVKGQGGNNNWNASAFSANTIGNYAYAQTVVTETGTDRAFGLSDVNAGIGFNGIDYKFFLRNNGQLRIYEGTSDRGAFGNYALNDTLKIGVVDGDVVYYLNSTLLYTSSVSPSLPLHIDISMNDQGGVLSDIQVVSLTTGDFFATVTNAGSNPSYQWKLNGTDVGTDSDILNFPAFADGDVFTVEITPDIPGCANIINPYTSNRISINTYDAVLPVELLSFTGTVSAGGAELRWQTASELDNDHFIVLRSSDGEMFEQIGRVQGQGTTFEKHEYSFTDPMMPSSSVYYRLDQADYDGTRRMLGLIRLMHSEAGETFRILTNPVADGVFRFFYQPGEPVDISVFSVNGHELLHVPASMSRNLDMNGIQPGIYLIKLVSKKHFAVQRILVR